MALTVKERAISAARTRAQNLALMVQDKDKAIKEMRRKVAGLKLEKRASRGAHTVGAVLGGAVAGGIDAVMTDSTIEVMGQEIPLIGLGAVGVRVLAETMDPDSDGAGFTAAIADGAIGYSAGVLTKQLVTKWTE